MFIGPKSAKFQALLILQKEIYIFCLRFVGLLEFNNQYVFIHRFSDFYDHTQKKLFPIKQVPELKNYMMKIEYFRENYREMK